MVLKAANCVSIKSVPSCGCPHWISLNTLFLFLSTNNEAAHAQAHTAFRNWGAVFVKAASQGSSVGCYKVTDAAALSEAVNAAFGYSDQVLVEKAVRPRELEVAVYRYNDQLVATRPGEIATPSDSFYSYEEKYSAGSHSTTLSGSAQPERRTSCHHPRIRAESV